MLSDMTTGQLAGWIGGIAGALLGLAGGVIGTYFSIRNTQGPRERAFMVRCALVCWGAILGFLALLVCVPDPYRGLLWIPYGILLPLGIMHGNRRQQAIRSEEARDRRAVGAR